jgi:GNAT superfamily N-acetyltransferase
MTTPFLIRPAKIADAPQLAELLAEIGWFTSIKNEDRLASQRRIASHLTLCANDSHSVYVAIAGETVLGYVAVHWLPYLILAGPEGYISELFVRPLGRGQGVGSQLLDTAVDEARRRGCYRLSLLNNQQRESYQRHFYTKRGWEERPAMKNFVLFLKD